MQSNLGLMDSTMQAHTALLASIGPILTYGFYSFVALIIVVFISFACMDEGII